MIDRGTHSISKVDNETTTSTDGLEISGVTKYDLSLGLCNLAVCVIDQPASSVSCLAWKTHYRLKSATNFTLYMAA